MRIPQLAVAATAALLLSACGGDDGGDSPLEGMTGSEVATAAADALEEAGAVHVEGTINQDGGEITVDLQLQGDDTAGTLAQDGVEFEILGVDGEQFIRAGADFWASSGIPAQVAATLDGEWVAVPAEEQDFGALTLAGIVESLRTPESTVSDEVGEDEIDGQAVVVVEQEDGGKLFVADDDPAYPLRVTNEGEGSGSLDLSGFGEEEDLTAPADAIDLAELAGS